MNRVENCILSFLLCVLLQTLQFRTCTCTWETGSVIRASYSASPFDVPCDVTGTLHPYVHSSTGANGIQILLAANINPQIRQITHKPGKWTSLCHNISTLLRGTSSPPGSSHMNPHLASIQDISVPTRLCRLNAWPSPPLPSHSSHPPGWQLTQREWYFCACLFSASPVLGLQHRQPSMHIQTVNGRKG